MEIYKQLEIVVFLNIIFYEIPLNQIYGKI